MKFAESPGAVSSPRSDHGFSLVELLLVTVILSSLALVVAAAVRGITSSGQDATCAQQRRVVSTAIESYFASHDADSLPGVLPADGNQFERGLVSAAVIRDVSTYFDVAADGSVVPETGSPCS